MSSVSGLERLENTVAGLRAGVVEMEQSPSYLMLVDADPSTVTGAKFATAVGRSKDLWLLLDVLTTRVGEARAFVDQNKLTTTSTDRRRLATLAAMLARPVTISASHAGVASTLDGQTMPIQSVVDRLHDRYDAVYQGVAKIDRLWLDVLPRIEAARETVVRLQAEAKELDVVEPLIGRALSRAEDLAERLMSDPISVDDNDGLDLDRQVAEAARQMASLRTGFDNLDTDLDQTEELLASLRVMRSRAAATAEEARAKIVGSHDVVAVPAVAILDAAGGMASQLDDVVALARQLDPTRWTQQRAVLDSWLNKANRLEQQLVEAERRNRRPLDQRDELRGRLQAFQAKMATTGHAENPSVMARADDAWTELYTAPTDLAKAEAAIAELAAELRKS